MHTINKNPSVKELRLFGLALMTFFGMVGAIVLWRTDSLAVPKVLWTIGVAVGVLYYAIPPLRRPVFIGWSYLTWPLGWLLTHVILAFVFFVLLMPLGIVMRLFGRDTMGRRFDADADTYWVERSPTRDPGRYFRQY